MNPALPDTPDNLRLRIISIYQYNGAAPVLLESHQQNQNRGEEV